MLAQADAKRYECIDGVSTRLVDDLQQQRATDLARAAVAAADADAPVLYRVAANREFGLSAPEQHALLQRLTALDTGNLAVLLLELESLDLSGNPSAFDRWLQRASKAVRVDEYFGVAVTILVDNLRRVPASDDLLQAASWALDEPVDKLDVALQLTAFGLVAATGPLNWQGLTEQCDPHRASRWSPTRARLCVQVATALASKGGSLIAVRVGLSIWHRLVEGLPEQAAAIDAERAVHWQQQAAGELTQEMAQVAYAEFVLAHYRNGLGEVEIQTRLLQQAGVSPTPPTDWNLPAEQLQARQDRSPTASEQADRRAFVDHIGLLFNSLGERRDPDAQLGRLLLLHVHDWQQMLLPSAEPAARWAGLDRRAVVSQLIDDPAAGPHVLYRLAADLPELLSAAQRAVVLERLRTVDSDNLAVHLLIDPEADAEEPRLAAAGQARRFDSYYADTLRLLLAIGNSVQLPARMRVAVAAAAGAHDMDDIDAGAAAAMMALGITAATATPDLNILRACGAQHSDGWSESRTNSCLRIVRTLALHSDTAVAQRFGLTQWHRLVEGEAAEAEVLQAKRAAYWLHEAGPTLAPEDPTRPWPLMEHYRSGLSELDAYRALLHDAGVSLTPPDDWQPVDPDMMSASR